MERVKDSVRLLLAVFVSVFIFIPYAGSFAEAKEPVVGRMKVTIMPEYESPTVLVVQEGKFASKDMFPMRVKFNLPDGVKKLYDVCSLSPGGQHFCQVYDIITKGGTSYVDVGLPYSDFFVDFSYEPFKAKENSGRKFSYRFESPYKIKTLEMHVQKPYRSKDFLVSPENNAGTYEKNGFEYLKYVYKDVEAGAIKDFAVSYYKADAEPSVDIKYTGKMSGGSIFQESGGELLLVLGLLILFAVLFFKTMKHKKNEG